MHLDHVDPLGNRGPDELANLVAACIGCNLEKSDKHFPELLAVFGGILPGAIVAEQMRAARARGEGPCLLFHEPRNERRELISQMEKAGKRLSLNNPLDYYKLPEFAAIAKRGSLAAVDSYDWTRYLWMECCRAWELASRPYFNVYPIVVDALTRTRLELTAAQACGSLIRSDGGIAVGFGGIAVCFSVRDEPTVSGYRLNQLQVVVLGMGNATKHSEQLIVLAQVDGSDGPRMATYHIPLSKRLDSESLAGSSENPDTLYQLVVRLAVGVLILAQDEKSCEPILLTKDRKRRLTDEQYEMAVARARQRTGMRGCSIGRDWIASPHVRRPHFAIRWTERGRTTPRLVPVKGCIVRRSELLEVPTGYKSYQDEQ